MLASVANGTRFRNRDFLGLQLQTILPRRGENRALALIA